MNLGSSTGLKQAIQEVSSLLQQPMCSMVIHIHIRKAEPKGNAVSLAC
jgi:hypothetical protein